MSYRPPYQEIPTHQQSIRSKKETIVKKIALSSGFGISAGILLFLLAQFIQYALGWQTTLHLKIAALTGFVLAVRLIFMVTVFAEYLNSYRSYVLHGCVISISFFLMEWFIRDFEKGFTSDTMIKMIIYTTLGGLINLAIRHGRSLG